MSVLSSRVIRTYVSKVRLTMITERKIFMRRTADTYVSLKCFINHHPVKLHSLRDTYVYQNCIPTFPFDLPMRSNTYTFAVHALHIGTLMFISIISSVHNMCMDVCTHVITSIGYTVASLIKNFLTTNALLINCSSLINSSCKHVIELYSYMCML